MASYPPFPRYAFSEPANPSPTPDNAVGGALAFCTSAHVSNSVLSLTKSQHTPSPSDGKRHRCRALGCSPRASHFSVQNNVVPGIGPYLYQGLDFLCTLVRIL